jgi:hypothetical protein
MKRIVAIRQSTSALLKASAGAWALMAYSAQAQTAPIQTAQAQPAPASSTDKADTLQEVVVTGIRASLQRAQAIKRDASSVVEAVTLEDLGKFADTNVWANRLIGDEQEPADLIWEQGDPDFHSGQFLKAFPDWFLKREQRPSKGRYTFTTWN